jgi:hypothetical protein
VAPRSSRSRAARAWPAPESRSSPCLCWGGIRGMPRAVGHDRPRRGRGAGTCCRAAQGQLLACPFSLASTTTSWPPAPHPGAPLSVGESDSSGGLRPSADTLAATNAPSPGETDPGSSAGSNRGGHSRSVGPLRLASRAWIEYVGGRPRTPDGLLEDRRAQAPWVRIPPSPPAIHARIACVVDRSRHSECSPFTYWSMVDPYADGHLRTE